MAVIHNRDLDFLGVARIKNLPDPIDPGDAATKSYVDSLLEGLAWKDDVACASTSNINIASPPSVIDDYVLQINDRLLLKDQSDPRENGIYVYKFQSHLGSILLVKPNRDATHHAWFQSHLGSILPQRGARS